MTKFVVCGHTGVVGGQLYRWLRERGADVAGVSLDREDGDAGEAAWAFVCLPTPNGVDGDQNQSAIYWLCTKFIGRPVRVVIRSTVLPNTCGYIAQWSKNLTVYHWPEFLSARTAWQDFTTPRVHLVGCDMTPRSIAAWNDDVEPLLPVAAEGTRFMTTQTSETVKYAHNVHGALQIIYANQMYDVCNRACADWRMVQDALPLLGYVSREQAAAYWDVWKDNKRGYAGACFPKDVAALQAWLQRNNQPSELLDGMEAANARLRRTAVTR